MSEKKIQVTLGNYKGVEVKKAEIIITEEEVKAELERARQYAVTTQDKDGAAELGDEAVIDFVGYIDGEAFAGGDGTDFPLKLGSNTFIPGFEDQLVGAKKDDNVDVVVTVKGVRSSFLPELSDEVVQKISQCKTVAEFEEFVRKSIHDFKQNQADMEKENKVLEQIVEASEIEVPQEFIDERKEQLKNNLLAQLRNAGNTFEQYLQYNGLTEELFEEYAAKDALSMLKGQAVLQEIAKAEGFSYTDEDVDQTIAAMAMSYQMPAEQLREMMGERGVAMVAEDILSKQALEFIVKEAVEA